MYPFNILGFDSDDRTDEQIQKEKDDDYNKWFKHYKSLDEKEKKREMRKNTIIIYSVGILLMVGILTFIVAVIIIF